MRACLGICILAIAVGGAACHEDSGVAVKSLSFQGNSAFPDSRLKAVLATKKSGWFPWSAKHYFDRSEFERDARRLQAFYADRGFPEMRIAGVDVKLNDKKDAVNLTITIDEGAPVVVDAVHFVGFDDLPSEIRKNLDTAPIQAGQPRDRANIRATRDLGARLLRDNGYPYAKVEVTEQPGADAAHTVLTVHAEPGTKAYFGEATITGLESVGENVVRRELSFHQGDLYRESVLTRSQQRLRELGLFEFAHIAPASEAQTVQVPLKVTMTEGRARELRLSGGYGSEERLRGTVRWSHLNFFGGARHATADAKYSAIDRGVKLSFIEPYFLRRGFSLNVSGTGWKTSQLTYDTSTFGGRATVGYHSDTGLTGLREAVHREVRIGYVHEYLRYGITNSLEDQTRRDERIALGLDPDSGRSAGTLSAIDLDLERVAVDDALNPHRGTITSAHFEDAFRFLRGAYHYQELMFEGRAFLPLGKTVVWANRARIGTLFAGSVSDMPFSARYFLGGSTSVRGWGRFEVSPLNSEGLPVGGRSLLEASTELRFPIRGKLSGVAFIDAGQVGAESARFEIAALRYAAGPGMRYMTPIGAVRVDLGVQLNRVPGLVINGSPERRRWRLHFSIGQAF